MTETMRALQEENERLRAALEQFADTGNWVSAIAPMGDVIDGWAGQPHPWRWLRDVLTLAGVSSSPALAAQQEQIACQVVAGVSPARETIAGSPVSQWQPIEPKADALRLAQKALQQIEWFGGGTWSATCLWCQGYERHPAMDQDYYGKAGHTADCPRQRALAAIAAALPPTEPEQ